MSSFYLSAFLSFRLSGLTQHSPQDGANITEVFFLGFERQERIYSGNLTSESAHYQQVINGRVNSCSQINSSIRRLPDMVVRKIY